MQALQNKSAFKAAVRPKAAARRPVTVRADMGSIGTAVTGGAALVGLGALLVVTDPTHR